MTIIKILKLALCYILLLYTPYIAIAQSNDRNKLLQFEQAITQGEEYLKAKDYQRAKLEYQKALSINPDAKYPKDKLTEIRKVFIDPQDELKFKEAVNTGDGFLNQKNFQAAKEQYYIALSIKPDDKVAREKMLSAEKLVTDFDSKIKEFNILVAKADKLFSEKNFSGAKIIYEQASKLDIGESYPSVRVSEIEDILSKQKVIDEKYTKSVLEADDAYMNRDFIMAISKYEDASLVKPGESYPKSMIARAKESLTLHQNNNQAYTALIAEADQHYIKKEFAAAIIEYEKALKILPDEKYPQEQVNSANSIILLAKEENEKYLNAIAIGDQLFKDNTLKEAVESYKRALMLKPTELYPKQKIEEINIKFDEQKTIDSKYTNAINQADQYFNQKDFDKAIEFYQEAIAIKQEEQYPKDAIIRANLSKQSILEREREIEELIIKADKNFDSKRYEEALLEYSKVESFQPNNNHVQARIIQINDIILSIKTSSEKYNQLLSEGDFFVDMNQLENAISKYIEAANLKPEESYPKTKIVEISRKIEDNKLLLAKQAEESIIKQNRFKQIVKEAHDFYVKNDLENALIKYKSLLSENQNDQHVNEMIKKISDQLYTIEKLNAKYDTIVKRGDHYLNHKEYNLAEEEFLAALKIKSGDYYARSKIDEIARKKNEEKTLTAKLTEENRIKEARLRQMILEADALFAKNDFRNALIKYKLVEEDNPNDLHVMEMIEKIHEKQKTIERINANYYLAIKNGDQYLKEKQFDSAEIEYTKALEIRPDEALVKQKLYDVAKLSKESRVMEARTAEEAKIRQAEFDKLIQDGDVFFNRNEYVSALNSYSNAAKINKSDEYIKGRIREITSILEQNTFQVNISYNEALEKATQFYKDGDFRSALVQYELASLAKPLEKLPKDKIIEINNILIERTKNNLALYNKLILVADEYYQTRIYDKALEEYEKASAAYPEEQYPFRMITRIKKEVEENAIVELVNYPINLTSGNEKKFNFKVIEMRARKNNYLLIKAKKTSEKPPKIFINYGEGNLKSGGMVMKGIDGNDTKEYLLRISIQDMWYRKDNNWISLYSEGGDIEITSLQISQGDSLNLQLP